MHELTSQQTVRILVIEDNAEDENKLTRVLSKAKLINQALILKDLETAIQYLTTQTGSEDLIAIFLDIDFLGERGLEVFKEVRSCEWTKHITVFMMSSSQSTILVKRCEELGNARYMQTPLTISSFSSALADLFHRPRHSDRSKNGNSGDTERRISATGETNGNGAADSQSRKSPPLTALKKANNSWWGEPRRMIFSVSSLISHLIWVPSPITYRLPA